MNKHLNQCELNEEFLASLNDKFPDLYFDWKVTVVFYCATHLIRGYALSINAPIDGRRHEHVFI